MSTERVAAYIVQTDYGQIPAEAVDAANKLILDTLGVTLAGCQEPGSRLMAAYVRDEDSKAEAGIIGSGFKSLASQAAWVNGTMAHSLDYDDAHMYTRIHLSAPLLAALFPVAEFKRSTGSELIAAFVARMETAGRIGPALGDT